MKKLGILVDNLGTSQLSYNIIKNINEYLRKNKNVIDPIVFYDTLQYTCLTPLFSTMNAVECWGYTGNIITTSVKMAYKISKLPHNIKTYLYVWDLEWLRAPRLAYEYYSEIYCNFPLIARSNEHAAILKNNWNANVIDVNDNFDFERMVDL